MVTVVKIGGNVVDDETALGRFAEDFAAMEGPKVLIHGGGVMASRMQERLGMEPVMLDGRRVTDDNTLKIVTMVYSGWCNRHIVALLQKNKCNAIGMTGADGNSICAKRRPPVEMPGHGKVDFGHVGDVTPECVNTALLEQMLQSGITPVFCAINHDGNGHLLNTNADTVASSVAVALACTGEDVRLIYCFEKDGVLNDRDDDKSVMPVLTPEMYSRMRREGRIAGGMIPKLDNAFRAIGAGVSEVIIKNAAKINSPGGTVLSESLSDAAARLLREMISIPSPSFGEEEVCRHISSRLTEYGIRHTVLRNNIVALCRHFSPEKPTLMLNAHIDTVAPSPGYSFDPYCPDRMIAAETVKRSTGRDDLTPDDVIGGLGSNDDGGSVVSLISVFRHFMDRELPVNLMLALTSEEERSGSGGMAWLWDNLPATPTWAIIGEPTGMKAAVAERGLLVLDGEATGVSGHAAGEGGVNALYVALQDIERLRNHEFDRISPRTGRVRLTVTQINAGTAHNVIPDRCTFTVDIRPTEMYTNEEILRELQTECKCTLTARNLKNRASATREGSPLKAAAESLGIDTYSSPTTSDWMRVGCDAMKMGPGESSRSHKKDEFILKGEIIEAIGTYIRYVEKFCELAV